jgi:hypothetical protein
MTHLELASTARQCLDHFATITAPDMSAEEAAEHLIANIGHYYRAEKLDFLAIIKRGIGHWHAGRLHPNTFAPLPHVSIHVQ